MSESANLHGGMQVPVGVPVNRVLLGAAPAEVVDAATVEPAGALRFLVDCRADGLTADPGTRPSVRRRSGLP